MYPSATLALCSLRVPLLRQLMARTSRPLVPRSLSFKRVARIRPLFKWTQITLRSRTNRANSHTTWDVLCGLWPCHIRLLSVRYPVIRLLIDISVSLKYLNGRFVALEISIHVFWTISTSAPSRLIPDLLGVDSGLTIRSTG